MDIEQIKADRGKESFERWYATQPNFANGWWVVASDEDGDNYVDESGDGGFEEVTARRIARVPDLEAAVIAQDALIKELVEALDKIENGLPAGSTLLSGADPLWRDAYRELQRIARIAKAKAAQ